VVDKSQLDYQRYHDGDEERAFRRFIYLLVFNCFCPLLDDDDQLVLFLDERDGADLSELCTILNRALRTRRGRKIDVIRSAQWIDSKRSSMMQLNDVLMGAVACHNNNGHVSRTSGRGMAKCELAAAIASQFNLADLCERTPAWARHFGIWHLRLHK
jgi:hypothetical protein